MKKLAIAFVLGAFSTLLLGAASSYVYRHKLAVGVSQPDATTGANWFIGRGAWDQGVADMDQCRLSRTASLDLYPTGFVAECYGRKTVPADSLPEGVRVLQVIN
jgi:hypothetical protein